MPTRSLLACSDGDAVVQQTLGRRAVVLNVLATVHTAKLGLAATLTQTLLARNGGVEGVVRGQLSAK
jgi:hypothetical protein